ncbi:MAG: ComF family protein [Clostridia bacterium]|nr:ComF family protein [Clostridia bacterium]
MSKFLENQRKSFENLKKYDIIIIVPISDKRKKERGYNQSELLAKEISKILLIEYSKQIIYKIKDTQPQSVLNKRQRQENVKGVYEAKNIEKVRNKKILIIDDIYTTGNTVNECAKVLVQKGIDRKNIGVLTIAKD